MNIFALDLDATKAAKYHVNKHVIKMILEHCQLLSTAHRVLDGTYYVSKTKSGRNIKRWDLPLEINDFVYLATHINHPSAIWARETYLHYQWLVNLTKALCKEYTYRYGKVHKCEEIGLVDWFDKNYPKNIDMSMTFRLPDVAMPDYCKIKGDVVSSYRKYYNEEKRKMFNWEGKVNSRPVPDWIEI